MASKSTKSTSGARRKARAAAAERADKSLDQFRNALERSVTLSRERIEEVMDDAVKRGRMTRDDANELVTKLVDRGRKQTEDLLGDVESTLKQLRDEFNERAERARDRAQEVIGKAGIGSARTQKRAKKAAAGRKGGKQTAAKRSSGGGSSKPSNPVANYDSLSAADLRKRLTKLSDADLRAVRTAEKRGKGRKTVLADIEKRLKS